MRVGPSVASDRWSSEQRTFQNVVSRRKIPGYSTTDFLRLLLVRTPPTTHEHETLGNDNHAAFMSVLNLSVRSPPRWAWTLRCGMLNCDHQDWHRLGHTRRGEILPTMSRDTSRTRNILL